MHRQKKIELPAIHTAYEGMTGFFTAEAAEDCLSMIQSLIAITNHYCNLNNNTGDYFFFLPRRISQDLVENTFSRIRVAIGHGRLDHITTFNACTEVNMIKEIKISERSSKRRNAAGGQIEKINSNKDYLSYDDSIEYASKCRKKSFKNRSVIHENSNKLIWKIVNGIKMIENEMQNLSRDHN